MPLAGWTGWVQLPPTAGTTLGSAGYYGSQATTSGYWYPVVNYDTLSPALGAGIRFDFGPHGSLFLIGETFGSHSIYTIYGNNQKVTLVAASMGLM